MSYTTEFQVDSTGEWRGGAVCFATEEEAIAYIVSRDPRGTSLLDIRVVQSGDPVNFSWVNSKAERVTPSSSRGTKARDRAWSSCVKAMRLLLPARHSIPSRSGMPNR
jgi:hypothetical protein